jgi:hypothetical protein
VPSGRLSVKNPTPSIAASNGPPDFMSLPCSKSNCFPVKAVPKPEVPSVSAANLAALPLNPGTSAFAKLSEIVSRLFCCAAIPVAAANIARFT